MKLLLIDGNSIVNRAFFGIRMLNAPDGTPTNGIYGFLTILQRLLDEQKPDALAVAFDLHAPTFRAKLYEGYKATRKPMPDELRAQDPVIRALVGALGFLLLMSLQRDLGSLKRAVHDKVGMRYALIMTVFGPVLGVSLSLMAVQYTNAGIASTLMALTPVFILFPYAFLYKQRIRLREVIGVAVSMAGVALFFLL